MATGSLHFDGNSQMVLVTDAAALHTPSLTVEAWTQLDTLYSPYRSVAGKPVSSGGSSTCDSWTLWYENHALNGGVQVCDAFSSIQYAWTPVAGVWHHLAYRFDSDTYAQTLFVDGVAVVSGISPRAPTYDGSPLMFGADRDQNNWSGFLGGTVADVRLWSTARSDADILIDMSSCIRGDEVGLVGAWLLDEGSGQTAHDLGPNHLDGTLGLGTAADSYDPQWSQAAP